MDENSRRTFLSRLLAGAGAAMAIGSLPDFSLAHEHAVAQLRAGENQFAFFTPEEARQMEAVCEQIIPSDDGPGAREAGAIYFIDYALSQTEPHLQPVFRSGLKELAAACAPDKFNE
jgi:gluconate 2-dehydrogenase gamma chain